MNITKFIRKSIPILLTILISCSSDDGGKEVPRSSTTDVTGLSSAENSSSSDFDESEMVVCQDESGYCATMPLENCQYLIEVQLADNWKVVDECLPSLSSSSIAVSSSSSSSTAPSSSSANCAGFTDGAVREHYGKYKPQFCDKRDDKKYVHVTIGNLTWMAENLNYAAPGSKCGTTLLSSGSLSDENTDVCDTYGRLYDWSTASEACPEGWRLPGDEEWVALVQTVNLSSCDYGGLCQDETTQLMTTSGWYVPINFGGGEVGGTDNYGFSALPGGYGNSSAGLFLFYNVSNTGYWWAAKANYYAYISSGNRTVFYNTQNANLYSVRCVQDPG